MTRPFKNNRNYKLDSVPPTVHSKENDDSPKRPKLPLVKASALGVWHVDTCELEAKLLGRDGKRIEFNDVEEWNALVEKKKELGKRLMMEYAKDYELSKGRNGSIKLVMATQRSGTVADKVSAFSIMVADNPVANTKSLDALLAMVTSKVGKRHALVGFETLKELFISRLLPDRKLKNLFQRPINHVPNSKEGNSLLLFWYWEEMLKQRYERFVSAIEEASRDMLPVLKDKALKTIYILLKCKSELEHRLLSALVNKLGDPESKVASNADFHLLELLQHHPNMKAVVIDEVDSFVFRPHLGLRSKYHAVNFLSQIPLTCRGDGPALAKRLMDLYFAVFKVLTFDINSGGKPVKSSKVMQNKKVDPVDPQVGTDSRILSALLTGVNRAFPFVSSDEIDDIIAVQTPILFKLVHSQNFNVGIEALMLLHKISSKNQVVSDRFYRALYSKLLLPAAMYTSKVESFFGLLRGAMKNDINLGRVAAFSKRLLHVALQVTPPYACGCLFLLSEILKAKPSLWKMMLQNESNDNDDDDDGIEHFIDIVDDPDENKIDTSKKRNIPSSVCRNDGDDYSADSDTNNISAEVDVSEDYDNHAVSDAMQELLSGNDLKNNQHHKKALGNDEREGEHSESVLWCSTPQGYNPRSREPSYSNADRVSWWELTALASHVHPSVSAMARTLLSGAHIIYNGNPLNDLSLTAFLDKFMEKKPKESSWHGGSKIGPAKEVNMNNHLIGSEILSLAKSEVPPEDVVFHKFYMNKISSRKVPKRRKKKNVEDEGANDFLKVGEDDDYDLEDMDDDGDYDYDDLDKIAMHEDGDLAGNVSDGDMGISSDSEDGLEDKPKSSKKQRKSSMGASPFADLDDFKHMIGDDKLNNSRDGKKKKPRRA